MRAVRLVKENLLEKNLLMRSRPRRRRSPERRLLRAQDIKVRVLTIARHISSRLAL